MLHVCLSKLLGMLRSVCGELGLPSLESGRACQECPTEFDTPYAMCQICRICQACREGPTEFGTPYAICRIFRICRACRGIAPAYPACCLRSVDLRRTLPDPPAYPAYPAYCV